MNYEHFDEMHLDKNFVLMTTLRWDDQWFSACREWKSFWTYQDPAESTDRSCALDMRNTARSFTHESTTYVIRRLAFLNLGFIDPLSCTPLGVQDKAPSNLLSHKTKPLPPPFQPPFAPFLGGV